MAKTNYNGVATAGASKQIVEEDNARISVFFNNLSDKVMVLNFGANASATDILTIPVGGSIFLTPRDPFQIKKSINVFCADADNYECQIEN